MLFFELFSSFVYWLLVISPALCNGKDIAVEHRQLQFEGMVDFNQNQRIRRRKGSKTGLTSTKTSRSQSLNRAVEDIILNADRYHMWWTGPAEEATFFRPETWSIVHNASSDAIFTMAVIQGRNDSTTCSSPNDLKLYLGTARKFHKGDIVIALEADTLTTEIKNILKYYKAIVYLLPAQLCSKATDSIFCGSEEERVPASVFRFYFYEKWATLYQATSRLLVTDFRDIIFQSDPFAYHKNDISVLDYQLAVFQEFHPNMVINRCRFNKRIMQECFGEEALRTMGDRIIVSSGALMGTRDGMLVWSHHMTMQLQDAPGRMVETRCTSGGIDHSFINWLVYGNKLRQLIRTRIYPHGEGMVNSLGGLRPDTVVANITGKIGSSFWKVLSDEGYILNWNGEIAPVVHQLDHFIDELIAITDGYINNNSNSDDKKTMMANTLRQNYIAQGKSTSNSISSNSVIYVDRAWQALAVSQCLFDCKDSIDFTKM